MFKTLPKLFQTSKVKTLFAGFHSVGVCRSFSISGRKKKPKWPDSLRKLSAAQPYAGTADPPGYAGLAAGPDFIVCVDLDGCIFRYDSKTPGFSGWSPVHPGGRYSIV